MVEPLIGHKGLIETRKFLVIIYTIITYYYFSNEDIILIALEEIYDKNISPLKDVVT